MQFLYKLFIHLSIHLLLFQISCSNRVYDVKMRVFAFLPKEQERFTAL